MALALVSGLRRCQLEEYCFRDRWSQRKTDPYLGYAQANAQEPTSALNWQFQALIVSGSGNSAALYIPWQLNALVPASLASGANLANRSIKENGNPSFYRVGAWRDNSTPVLQLLSRKLSGRGSRLPWRAHNGPDRRTVRLFEAVHGSAGPDAAVQMTFRDRSCYLYSVAKSNASAASTALPSVSNGVSETSGQRPLCQT